jgi:hypothetical protein
MHNAISTLRTDILSSANGWRENAVPTIVVFIVENSASDSRLFEAEVAHLDNSFGLVLERYAFGFGSYNATQLLLLAGNVPSRVHQLDNLADSTVKSKAESFTTSLVC